MGGWDPRDGTSRKMREYQIRFCEKLSVKFTGLTRQFPGPTRQISTSAVHARILAADYRRLLDEAPPTSTLHAVPAIPPSHDPSLAGTRPCVPRACPRRTSQPARKVVEPPTSDQMNFHVRMMHDAGEPTVDYHAQGEEKQWPARGSGRTA